MPNTVLSCVMSKMNRHFKKYQPVLLFNKPHRYCVSYLVDSVFLSDWVFFCCGIGFKTCDGVYVRIGLTDQKGFVRYPSCGGERENFFFHKVHKMERSGGGGWVHCGWGFLSKMRANVKKTVKAPVWGSFVLIKTSFFGRYWPNIERKTDQGEPKSGY